MSSGRFIDSCVRDVFPGDIICIRSDGFHLVISSVADSDHTIKVTMLDYDGHLWSASWNVEVYLDIVR